MSLSPQTPNFSQLTSTAHSFWDRKEGSFARWVLIGVGLVIAAAVVFAWGLLLPILIGIVGNTIQLAALCGLFAVLASPLYSSRVRGFLSTAFQMSMYWSYRKLIGKDPIVFLKSNIVELTKEAQTLDESVTQLSGSKQRIADDIQVQMDTINKNAGLWQQAKKMVTKETAKLDTLKGSDLMEQRLKVQDIELSVQGYLDEAGTAKQTIVQEQPILKLLDESYERMCTIRNLAQFKIKNLSRRADMLSKRQEGLKSAKKSLGSAARLLKGDPQQQANIDTAYEMLNNEASDTLGALRDFSRFSEKYVTDMSVENSANASVAEKMFTQMEQQLALPAGEVAPRSGDLAATNNPDLAPALIGLTGATDDDFLKLLK